MTTEKNDTSRVRERQIVAEVGGPVDETRVTLSIHGPDVQPEEISAVLGCTPSSAHRRGDARRPGIPPWPQGAWLLSVEGSAPAGPDELVQQLLGRIPNDRAIWKELAAKYTVRVTFGIFVGSWNRGFELSSMSVRQLAVLGVPVGFDIYADGEEEKEEAGNK